MDGVLINSEPVHIRNEQALYKGLGLKISEEEQHTFIGVAAKEVWSRLINKHQLNKTSEEMLVVGRDIYLQSLQNGEVPPMEGGIDLARYFREQGMNVLLASSATGITINAVIKNFGWETDFDFLVSSDDIKYSKPEPDIFLKAAELAGVDPSHCVVIEDSTNGVKAAKGAGTFCIGYQSDLAPYQDLSEADLIVTSLKEVQIQTLQQLQETL